jgi:hypothetical protein
MKLGVVVMGMLAWASRAQADTLVVKGELSFTPTGFAKVTECRTMRVYTFGVMASSPYFQLLQQYEDLSQKGKEVVLVEVQGVLDDSTDRQTALTLQQPRIITLKQGTCGKERRLTTRWSGP